MIKNYKLGFEVWGLLIFLIIMIPNCIWFAVPAPNDVLRLNSITEAVDMIASVCQVLMIVALCFFKNKQCKKLGISPLFIAAIGCCLLYFISWIFYYLGIVNALVILGLTVPPCMVFLLFAMDRKNMIAIVPALIFTVCHLIYGLANFILQ